MGLFDKFFKTNEKLETKQAPKLYLNQINAYESKSIKDYKAFSKDGYQENAIVYKCINLISTNASAVHLNLFDRNNIKIDSHEMLSLLKRPNPLQSGVEYFHSLISYLLISGNSYMLKDTEGMTKPKELYLLRPDRIKIKAGTSYLADEYQYIINGQILNKYPVDQVSGYSDIKHIKLWNPLDDFYGLSPIMASAYNVDQHNLAGLSNLALLKNGCMPSGMLKFMPKDETGQSTTLTDEQRARILEDLEFRFKGAKNSGRVMLAEGDFDYQSMGLSPKDMDFLELINMSAREIALVFGVPAQMVGIADQTYANVAEARLSLYEEAIIPLLKRIESDLNEWLVNFYNEDLRLEYDIDSIPAMAEKRRKIYENVNTAVNAGIITRNEARERLGLEPINGADSLLVPANLFPLGETEDSNEEADDEDKNFEDFDLLYGTKEEVNKDTFTTEEEARERAEELGCNGIHSHSYLGGQTVYMPCETHREYEEALGDANKALSDLDLKPTDAMAKEAQRGLDWRKEFKRGGTQIGLARANQLVDKENLSPDTVLRMYSFFSRHEVDKQAEGFKVGEEGYPSNGRIAWSLWGGDAGFSWSKARRDEIMREREKSYHTDKEEDEEEKGAYGLTDTVEKGLREKVKDHNDKYGSQKSKKVTLGMLASSFKRGIGAYRTNPSSVRPAVRASGGEDRWAYSRVNAFLYAVRTGRFRSGKFDLDLLPKGHPLSTRK